MTDFRTVDGFEDIWRPVAQPRRTPARVLRPGGHDVRARLSRIVRRAPEVMVKVTGRTRNGPHLKAHLDYISRNGMLDLEDDQGARLQGRDDVADLARDWAAQANLDRARRTNSPMSHSIILSMPAGTDPQALRLAARAFAREIFEDRFEYVFALHTDADHPHVHLSVRSCGVHGERLNPKKPDLELWRQVFAEVLRERGVEAEATPRRARGVTRRAERQALRQMADRSRATAAAPSRAHREAMKEAAAATFGADAALRPWEKMIGRQQARVRSLYLQQAALLDRSPDAVDRELAALVRAFVKEMPAPDSRRLALARALRDLNGRLDPPPPEKGRDR